MGPPVTAGACSCPSLRPWRPATRSPAISLQVRTGGAAGAWPGLLPCQQPGQHVLPLRLCLCPQPPGPPSSQVSMCEAFAIHKASSRQPHQAACVPRKAAPLPHPPELSVTAVTLRCCSGWLWLVRPASCKLLEGQVHFLLLVLFICSVVCDSVIPWTAVRQSSLFFIISGSLLKLRSIESVMPSNHLILCRPLLLPSIFPSIRVLSNESALPIRWPKYWCFSLSITPSNEYSGLISFRTDWFNLLAVQGTFKSLFQYHSSKASILQHSAFFMVQLSHLYMTIGKTKALTRQTFVIKVISLVFNMLSRLVITFLPRSKCLLISWV